jgi:hypothetical protein
MRVPGKEIGIATISEVQTSTWVLPRHETGPDVREERWSWKTTLGETIRFDRIFTVFTSRDVANPAKAARDHLASVGAHGFRTAAVSHVDAWHRRWEKAEIRIVGDDEAQRALRFATYHLKATKENKRNMRLAEEIVQELIERAKSGVLGDELTVGWHGGHKPENFNRYDDVSLATWARGCLKMNVRVGPRTDDRARARLCH